ncbi:DHA2 family efflux MFS transporter permease subunit, partial [Acidihalobacter prosperus]
VLLGLVALGMSITIIDVATPYVSGAFGMSTSQEQWLSTGFLAATTISIMVAPWCMNYFGERRTYIGTLLIFIFGSLIGGSSQDTSIVIVSRIILGISAGMIRPVAMTVLFEAFGSQRRGIATAIYGMSLGLPLTLAEVIGGWLVETFSWRWTFYITLPFAVLSILMAGFFLSSERSETSGQFDWIGLISLSVSIFSLLTALSNWLRWGGDSNAIMSYMGIAMVAGAFYIFWEVFYSKPMVDLRIFKNPAFAAGSLAMFIFGGVFYAIVYLLPLFSETMQNYSPLETGMLFLPSTAVLALLVPLVGHFSDRYSPLVFTIPAIISTLIGTWMLTQVNAATSFFSLTLAMALIAVGMSAFPPPVLARSISALPKHLLHYGSGAINFALQLGGALFTSVTVYALQVDSHDQAAALNQNVEHGHAATSLTINGVGHVLSKLGGLGAQRLHEAGGYLLGQLIFKQGHILGFEQAFGFVTLSLAVCLIPVFVLGFFNRRMHRAYVEE